MQDRKPRLGPFRLDLPIGKGGMGTVWQARHVTQDVRVAVKILAPEVARDPALLAAFRNEIRAVAALHHPNVVLILDHGEIPTEVDVATGGALAAGAPYLVMEYADHGNLSPLRGKLPWIRVKQILLALLDALAHAHARGVVHRDLKPANVLLTGRNLRVKLTDFGLVQLTQYARLHERDAADEPLEAGTPPYMAPEQLQGDWRDAGPWTDLFSLGNLAWSLVCGGAPLTGMPLPVVFYRVISRKLPEFKPLITVPEGFEQWIMRLLEPDPADRYQRAADAAWALMQLPDEVFEFPEDDDGGDEPTMVLQEADFPWEAPPLDVLSTLTVRRDILDSLLAELPPAHAIPPLPETWRRTGAQPVSMQLMGAGLGLFGMRTVPFVGREPQRDAIWERLRAVRKDHGPQVVLVRGAAGVGKSRLCAWITHRAHEVGSATVLSARHDREGGPEHGLGPMLLRWHQAADLPRDQLAERLGQVLERHGTEDPLETEALLDFLMPAVQTSHTTAALPSLAARHAVLARHLQRLSKERSGAVRPIVLLLDDLHWGTDTLAFLEWLLHEADGLQLPLLALGILQDEPLQGMRFEEQMLERIAANRRTAAIALEPLPDEDARELVQQLVGLDIRLADQVAERARGNPLFAVQLIGDWVRREVLVATPRGFVVREGEELPEDLDDVWAQRVDQVLRELTPDAMTALRIAAALGTSVNAREWETACAIARCAADPEVVDRMIELHLARVDDHGWTFMHGMFRDALLQQSPQTLPAIHRACLKALQRLGAHGRPGLTRRLAHHALEAGDTEEAAKHWLQAAEEALTRGDASGAEELCERADQALDRMAVPDEDLRRLRSLVLRAEALREQGAYDASVHLAMRAQELASGQAHLGIVADALVCRGHTARLRGQLGQARALLREAVDLYVGVRSPLGLADCLLALGVVSRQLGDLDGAMSLLQRSHDLFSRRDAPYGRAFADLELARSERIRGQHPQALEHLLRAREVFQALGSREGLGLVGDMVGLLALRAGHLDTAGKRFAKARERLVQAGSPRVVLVDLNLARLALQQGPPEGASAQLRAVLSTLKSLGWSLEIAACQAELLCTSPTWSAWDHHFHEVERILAEMEAFEPEAAHALERAGELALEAGQITRARKAFQLAYDQWTGVGRRLMARAVRRRLRAVGVSG